jgi:hypothetical protein
VLTSESITGWKTIEPEQGTRSIEAIKHCDEALMFHCFNYVASREGKRGSLESPNGGPTGHTK